MKISRLLMLVVLSHRRLLLLAPLLLFLAGCEKNNPTNPDTHQDFEAVGVVAVENGTDIVVANASGIQGSFNVIAGEEIGPLNLLFLKEDASRALPEMDDDSIEAIIADTTVATVSVTTTASTWNFSINGKNAGYTTLTFRLLHDGSATYVSPAIPVTVTRQPDPYLIFRFGDRFMYERYDRDINNSRIEDSKQLQVWTVLRTGLDMHNRSGVTEMERVTYLDEQMQIEFDRDTIYMQSNSNGELFQYDVLGTISANVAFVPGISESLPKTWVKVSETATTGQKEWSEPPATSIIEQQGLTLKLIFGFSSIHIGTAPTTIGAGTYPAAVRTNHTITILAEDQFGLFTFLDGELQGSNVVDSNGGMLQLVLDSKVLYLTVPGSLPAEQPFFGFSLELISAIRA